MVPILALALAATDAHVTGQQIVSEAIDEMYLPGLQVNVTYLDCGVVNAAYYAPDQRVFICNELLSEPDGVIRFITAHEVAHAIIDQYSIPVPGSEEVAADELAAVGLGVSGHPEAALEMAVYFAQHPADEDVYDDHPGNRKRAVTLECLGVGSEPEPTNETCARRYLHALNTWRRLIVMVAG